MTDRNSHSTLEDSFRAGLASVAGVGALMAGTAWVFSGAAAGTSAGAGALLATLNLYALAKIIGALLVGKRGLWGSLGIAKMLILFTSSWILLSRGWVSPLPFVLGLGSLPIGLALGTLHPPKV